MSVYGGDSWGREAECRKRRVHNLLINGVDDSHYKKLSNGKYKCLVCPHNPILDSPLHLSMHCKGSRHLAAESQLKERESMRKDEIHKRLAVSESHFGATNSTSLNKKVRLGTEPLIEQTTKTKPLIEQTRNATSEALSYNGTHQQSSGNQHYDGKLCTGQDANLTSEGLLLQQQWDFRERRERELKFIEAGWKRDCHGKWFRDENVEFDSDEEDPNECLRLESQN
ncbi:uncharacterized protein LOC126682495 [Mercurialis annua]|uniref:uncharacterized protein LOC126682495 n=1 Tax=Mercurialis annua TaxID=3986 RepID=UPI002160A48A|nr:uncharacterized protein LOC126682495 [Mercurialis annua]